MGPAGTVTGGPEGAEKRGLPARARATQYSTSLPIADLALLGLAG